MKEQIEKLYVNALNEDLPPNVFADQVLRLFNVSGSLPRSCYYQCKECNEWRMIGTFCKNPMTNQCDKDERYFYRGNDR